MVKIEPFHKKYSAKIILFGEYTVLLGGQALALPFNKYYASWKKGLKVDYEPFIRHIKGICEESKDLFFDDNTYNFFMNSHYFLDTTIPIGCGLGSSGSVVAAFYDAFIKRRPSLDEDITSLKDIFAKIESFFHGQSSGLDPLISFTNQSLLTCDNQITLVDNSLLHLQYELVDSMHPRPAYSVINEFKNKCTDSAFKTQMENLKNMNAAAILHLLNNDLNSLKKDLATISEIQYHYMDYLIPPSIKAEWGNLLIHQGPKYKLCGAGGGGYFLKVNVC